MGIPVADIPDITAMKPAALAGRGSKKDFVDLYFICKEVFTLQHAIALFKQKYQKIEYDPYHLLRSLTYFEDAEEEPMPEMIRGVTWEEIKQFFVAEAVPLFRESG